MVKVNYLHCVQITFFFKNYKIFSNICMEFIDSGGNSSALFSSSNDKKIVNQCTKINY